MSVEEQGLEESQDEMQAAPTDNTPPEEVIPQTTENHVDVETEASSEPVSAPVEQAETETAEAPASVVDEVPPDDSSVDNPPPEPETEGEGDAAPAPPKRGKSAKPQNRAEMLGIKIGDVITGTIVETSPTQIIVNIAEDVNGIVTGRELERMSRRALEEMKEGEEITVYVVKPNDHRGDVILSVNRAIEELDWQRAEQFRQEKTVYEDKIAGYNKGGLIVRFGRLRGFVPQSQISDDRRRRMSGETPQELYGSVVNDNIFVRVMEVDRGRNRLILSERAATRERRERRKASLIEELEVGQVMEGSVVSLEDFGAFVDIGGAEGLVHLTEISWSHVTHPSDVLKIGQRVKVEVISVDRNRKRIGLSVKRQAADPWDEIATTYQVGDLVQGSITKLTKFGAFAQLIDAEEIEGLVHISELSDQRVNHPREVVNEGEKLTLRVVKIDVKNRRLGLSLKKVNSAEYLDRDMEAFAALADASAGAATGEITLEDDEAGDIPMPEAEADIPTDVDDNEDAYVPSAEDDYDDYTASEEDDNDEYGDAETDGDNETVDTDTSAEPDDANEDD